MGDLPGSTMGKSLSYGRWRVFGSREPAEKKLKEYGVFDLKGCTLGFMEKRCNELYPCRRLVILYAKMGLHRYNLLQGTKFQLNCVQKYIQTVASVPCSYYITLDAMDPTGGSSLETFQTKVSGGSFGKFILTCNIARIRGERRDDDRAQPMLTNIRMPEWPPENPFDNYYRLKESELQDNDWIRLYLELAVATPGARDALSELEIVNVVLGDEGVLNANNATLYIRYNEAALGKVSGRMAIVRRCFDALFSWVRLVRVEKLYQKSVKTLLMRIRDARVSRVRIRVQKLYSLAENKRIKLHLTGLANPNHLADAAGVSMEY